MPRGIGGDEAAERRAADRADQRRHGDKRHRVEQELLVDAAHQDQPADRRHHRSAQALHDAREDELLSECEAAQPIEPRTKTPMARRNTLRAPEAVGGPATRRDADREREQVRGDGELQRQRVGAERARDGRKRRRDHRRIHVLHEQRYGDDHRHHAVVEVRLHGFCYWLFGGPALSRRNASAGCWNAGSSLSAWRKSRDGASLCRQAVRGSGRESKRRSRNDHQDQSRG